MVKRVSGHKLGLGVAILTAVLLLVTISWPSPQAAAADPTRVAAQLESAPPEPTTTPAPTAVYQELRLGAPPALEPTAVLTATPSPTPTGMPQVSGRRSWIMPTATLPSLSTTATPLPTPTLEATEERPRGWYFGETQEKSSTEFATSVLFDDNKDFVKIGFHVAPAGDTNGLGIWMRTLNAHSIPFFLKSVGNAGPLYEAQEMMRRSGVPHTLVYRQSGGPYELPNYALDPIQAAREHWELHKAAFPPELDPKIVWYETINEVDKERSGWLGAFAAETARLALRDGYRWAAFGWSAGEPEPVDWTHPNMVEFLKIAAAHPDQIAIALHEYSYTVDDLYHDYPHQVGRFQQLFWVCDELDIPRPTVLITEFGWEYRDVPTPAVAMEHLRAAARLYATYPEVKGAAIWYLGSGFGDIDKQTNRLIAPLTDFAISHYYVRQLHAPIGRDIFD